jgi:acyl dehydratase
MNIENVWDYNKVQIGQEGPTTQVELTRENISEYAILSQNHDPKYSNTSSLLAVPTMALSFSPLLRWEIAKSNGFIAYEDSQKMKKQTPFAKCEIKWFTSVKNGDVITGHRKVFDKYERRGSKFVTFEVESKNQNNQTVSKYYYTCIFEYAKGQRAPREELNAIPFSKPSPSISQAPALLTIDTLAEGDNLNPLSVSESNELILRHNDFRLAGGKRDSNIHVDEEFAKNNIFGTAVNSGPATLSYVGQMLERNFDISKIYNNSSLLMRAITPVHAGDRVSFTGVISPIIDKQLITGRITGTNQNNNVVCIADFEINL